MRISALTFLLVILTATFAWAGSVTQVKGQKLIVTLEGEELSPGTEIYVISSAGKRIGLVTIRQVKGNKALGEITKGRANTGDTIQIKGATSSQVATATSESAASSSGSSRSKKGKHRGGVMAGYSMNSMTLTVQHRTSAATKEDITMKDNSFNLKGFYDYPLSEDFTVRGGLTYETFAAKGTTQALICNDGASSECSVNYSYVGFEGTAQYNFVPGPTRFWVGLGYSFLLTMGKANNIPNLTDSSTNQMVLVSTGADIAIGKRGASFIPLSLEYGMFPGSSNVNAYSILIRGGYGFTF